ncbi:AarF/ABC1/UbiB kinase family protein, partial [archaeon]
MAMKLYALLYFVALAVIHSPMVSVFSFRLVAKLVRPRYQCVSMSTFDRVFRRDLNQEKFLSFANEIKGILFSSELASVGVIRSLQVGKGLTCVIRDYTLNRNAFSTPDGQLSLPKVIRRLFEELGATYIKLGQFIASSPTIFPADYVEEFQCCLDNTPTVSYSIIRKIIQEDLKQPISNLYTYIDPAPLASASIAQVHRAQLKDGTQVVIKVRKPGVDSTLKADLAFLSIASKIVEFINPSLSALSVANIMEDIRESMLDELDFRKELKNLQNFRAFLERQQITDAVAPQPYLQASSERVLTMDYLQGVPLTTLPI